MTIMTDEERRRQMIAEAAYFRAERRGFSGGDPVPDWIEAEAEIDARLRRESERRALLERLEEGLGSRKREPRRNGGRGTAATPKRRRANSGLAGDGAKPE
ncbi:MAG TPA: DUF2934 domain-containing protein [Gammaproteobacteria bacterium]